MRIIDLLHFNIERIKGVYSYAKFLWQSCAYAEWDYEFLLDLIKFKLERMRDTIGSGNTEDAIQTAMSINEALKVLNNYMNAERREDKNKYRWEFFQILNDKIEYWWD